MDDFANDMDQTFRLEEDINLDMDLVFNVGCVPNPSGFFGGDLSTAMLIIPDGNSGNVSHA